MSADDIVEQYLLLGLTFDRLNKGFVDAYTGPPRLRVQVDNAPAPEPVELEHRAARLRYELAGASLPRARTDFIDAQLRALECSARKMSGQPVPFVGEVSAYFDVDIAMGDQDVYNRAHRTLDDLLEGPGTLAERYDRWRRRDEIPPDRLDDCVRAFSGALRERVRQVYPLPDAEIVEFDVVTDQPWSGFNYYLGEYRSRVAINGDLTQYMSSLPHLIAHEAYPGHHTEHCRKEALLAAAGQDEQTIFLVNTPQCLIAEGLADHALSAARGADWYGWATDIYADLGLRFDGDRARRIAAAAADLINVRQDAALMLHDRHVDVSEVTDYLTRWLLSSAERATQTVRFLSSSLWRAYITTYVEGYQLLDSWLTAGSDDDRRHRFGRLLDEPLTPGGLRAELASRTS